GYTGKGGGIEILDAIHGSLHDLKVENFGGRGLNMGGGVERWNVYNMDIINNRVGLWQFGNSNENFFYGMHIISNGEDANSNCMTKVNCSPVTHRFPAGNTGTLVTQTWQPNTSYKVGAIVSDGTNNQQLTACKGAPHCTSNLSGASISFNPTFQGTTADNGGVWTNIRLSTLLVPNYYPAVLMDGVNQSIDGFDIKSTRYEAGLSPCGEACSYKNGYFEGFHTSGEGRPHSGIIGYAQSNWISTLTAAITGAQKTFPVTNADWQQYFVNDPADISHITGGGTTGSF